MSIDPAQYNKFRKETLLSRREMVTKNDLAKTKKETMALFKRLEASNAMLKREIDKLSKNVARNKASLDKMQLLVDKLIGDPQ